MVRDCMVWYCFTLRSLRYVACATRRAVCRSTTFCHCAGGMCHWAGCAAACSMCAPTCGVCYIQVNQWLMLFNGMLSCIDALAHEVPSSVAYAAVAHTSSTHSAKATHRPGCHLTESFQTERPINRTRVRASNRRLSTGLPLYYSE